MLAALALLTWLSCPLRPCFGAGLDSRVLQTIEVHERYGVSHPMQIIDFDLDATADPATMHVLDEGGRAVPFQLLDGGKKLALQTDLPAHQSRRWKLVRGAAPQVSPSGGVVVREHAQDGWAGYEITNGLTGVRVPAPTAASSVRWRPLIDLMSYRADAPRVLMPAPVQGVLYRDGRWSGTGPNGVVFLATRLVGMHTRFLERGPLKVVVEVAYAVEHQEYKFGATILSPAGPGHYTCTITVLAGQPSVLFEEDTDLEMTWSMNLYPWLHPTSARYRGHHADKAEYGHDPDGRALRPDQEGVDAQIDLRYDKPLTPSYVRTETTLRPMSVWDPWAANTGGYWQLFDAEAAPDSNVAGIFAGRASRALSPGMSGVWIYTLPATRGNGPAAGISVASYRRGPDGSLFPRSRFQWGLFVGTKREELKEPTAVQPINLQMNLHGGFNLNKVRRYTVDFPDPPGGYGALYMDRQAIESLKDKVRQERGAPPGKGIRDYLYAADPQSRPLIDMWAEPTGGKLRDAVAAISKTATDMLNAFVNGAGIYDFRFHYWHGGLAMIRYGVWIDQVLADPRATEAQRQEVKAAAVLFANVLWDNDFVPMDNHHGINLGTANMPVQQAAYRNFYALLLARHPDMVQRARLVEGAVRRTVKDIINEHGAEIGCPHYIGASFEPTLTSLLQLKQLGREDPFKAEPRLAKFAEFFLNLLTPPERRVGGKRAFISIGDSSTEPSEIFGMLGTGFRDADAGLSARLMGAWRAGGKPHSFFFGTTLLMIDESLPAADPKLGDANFPGYYSVLRDGWGTQNETALWFVNGDYYSDHRHDDHGSIVIYALGKPLSIDWGSLGTPRVPGAYMHSGVVLEKSIGHPWDQDSPPLASGGRWSNSTQRAFATFKEGAFARASFQAGNTTWMRSVLSIHADAAHPILVIRDSFSGEGRDEPKVLSLNLMADGPVETPAGRMTPGPRRHPVRAHERGESGELPSASRPFDLPAGVNRLGFTGRYDVDWDVYTVGQRARALIGNWAVTPWGNAITEKEERQHILRIRGSGPFTTVILPWRRGARPEGLGVSRDGEAIVIRREGLTLRVDANSYTYADNRGTVTRRYEP